jgi:hypothetical protein
MSPAIAAFAFSTFFFGVLVIVALLEHRSHQRPKIRRRDAKRLKIEQLRPPAIASSPGDGAGLPRW